MTSLRSRGPGSPPPARRRAHGVGHRHPARPGGHQGVHGLARRTHRRLLPRARRRRRLARALPGLGVHGGRGGGGAHADGSARLGARERRQAAAAFVSAGFRLVYYVVVVALVVEVRRLVSAHAEEARVDPLTGAANTRAFREAAERGDRALRRYPRPLSILYLDVDDFKEINDSFGHGTGDRLLLSIGHMMTCSVRAADLAARLGGDEFVVLMPETERLGGRAGRSPRERERGTRRAPRRPAPALQYRCGHAGDTAGRRRRAHPLRRRTHVPRQATRQGPHRDVVHGGQAGILRDELLGTLPSGE